MFYKSGVDITNDRQMFEFLKNHFTYYTANTWNRHRSIANNVKLYNLDLSGDWGVAYSLLAEGEYETLNCMVGEWCRDHAGYEVYFSGRSGGYLVLVEGDHAISCILPECVIYSDTYEDYKEWCRENFGSVKANRCELEYYTRLVRDFDKLCDELRDYCDELSRLKFEVVEMEKTVERFNDTYSDDLELLGFEPLSCDGTGRVDASEIVTLSCLFEAFCKVADRRDSGYILDVDADGWVFYKVNY